VHWLAGTSLFGLNANKFRSNQNYDQEKKFKSERWKVLKSKLFSRIFRLTTLTMNLKM